MDLRVLANSTVTLTYTTLLSHMIRIRKEAVMKHFKVSSEFNRTGWQKTTTKLIQNSPQPVRHSKRFYVYTETVKSSGRLILIGNSTLLTKRLCTNTNSLFPVLRSFPYIHRVPKRCIDILRKEKTVLKSNDNRASAIFWLACLSHGDASIHLINAIFWANILLHIATVIM
jgi:hypothetical protein